LPVAGDRLNWRWTTLAAVFSGREPSARLEVEARRPSPGLVELSLANHGEADAPLGGGAPGSEIAVSWRGRLVAADALGGFLWEDGGPSSARLRGTRLALERLAPGEERTVGWLRIARAEGGGDGLDTEVTAHVLE
jgi:hypothetical protein